MNVVHAIIIGNVLVIAFNLIGMSLGMRPPPIITYAIGWPLVIAGIYWLGNV